MARKIATRWGFTIAEVLLSLALITLVVLVLIGLSMRSLYVNRKNLDTASGQLVAEQALERLAYDAESSASATVWGNNSLATPFSQTQVKMGTTTFNVTTYASDALAVPGKRLKRLRARVTWADAPQGKAGSGILNVEATRLVHEP